MCYCFIFSDFEAEKLNLEQFLNEKIKYFPVFAAFPLTDLHQKQPSACIYKTKSIAKNPKDLSTSVDVLSSEQNFFVFPFLAAFPLTHMH